MLAEVADIVNTVQNGDFNLTRRLVMRLVQTLQGKPAFSSGNWHPLGFLIFKLGTSADRQLRLHIWPETGIRPAEPNWPIHNHVFELTSCVLTGAIVNSEFSISDVPNADHRLFRVVYADNATVLEATPRTVSFDISSCVRVCEGSFYSVQAGSFHRSEAETGLFTASVVVTSSPQSSVSPLIVGSGNQIRHECAARTALDSESSALLDQLFRALNN